MTDVLDDLEPESKLQKAKRRIKASREAFSAQRDREEEDLKYQVPDLQWDAAARSARQGGVIGKSVTQARPTLSISKLDQPIQLVINQFRQAKLGVNIHPVSEKASKEGAEVRQGIYRRIERDSRADQGRGWAFERAVKAGMGAYLVTTAYDEEGGHPSDQEIRIQRILYQNLVGFDPAAQEADFSDGEYSWMGAWVPYETFKREFPKASISTVTENELLDAVREDSDWFAGSGRDRKVLVVTYFYKVHDTEEVEYGEGKDKQTRKRDKVTVRCAKLTASDILEDEETNHHLLPIIPALGRELQPFGSERQWVGMIRPAKDGQKLYNFAASTLVEKMAMEPKMPWIMAEGQAEGHPEWQQANTKSFAYLEYKPQTFGGQQAPPPQRAQVDQTGMSLAMMALQEADQFIQATTAIYDPSLGRVNPRDKSGKAILALQSQSDAGTSHFLAYFTDISLTYEARVVLDLMPAIYDRPGRVCRILTGEDKDKTVMLNKPFKLGEDGQPVAYDGKDSIYYDLSEGGGYAVSTTIGKSFQTRLQEGSEEIGQLLQAAPNLLPVIGDLYFQFQDIPGAPEIAKRLAKWREQTPGLQGIGEGEDGTQQPSADQLAAKIQAMEQQGQAMQAQLQQAMEMINTDRVKAQSAEKIAQLKAEADLLKQQQADRTKLQIEQMKAGNVPNKEAEQAREHAFEANQSDKERAHETQEHREEMAHEVALETTKARLRPIPTGPEKKGNGGTMRG
jgi:hypothetical protein